MNNIKAKGGHCLRRNPRQSENVQASCENKRKEKLIVSSFEWREDYKGGDSTCDANAQNEGMNNWKKATQKKQEWIIIKNLC